MVKRVMLFSLKEGVDPEKFWKFWDEKHGATFKNFPILKKYTINKVRKVVRGEPVYWGMVEVWYENEDIYNKSLDHPIIDQVRSDGFEEQIKDIFIAWVDEKVMKE